MKKHVLFCGLATLFAIALVAPANAQPISRLAEFALPMLDTTKSENLPSVPQFDGNEQLSLTADGHFVNKAGKRVRLFGTELQYTAQFIPSQAAELLAGRLSKLGFNAVRLRYNDYYGWEDGSLLDVGTDFKSTEPHEGQFARFDTLLNAFERNGIYSTFSLFDNHDYNPFDGVPTHDSTYGYSYLLPFLYPQAVNANKLWAKNLLHRVNSVTNKRYVDHGSLAMVELLREHSLFWWWSINRLNYINDANVLTAGAYTITYHQSRRLDTLFSLFLKNKYTNEAGINAAWRGTEVTSQANLLDNGSFEKLGSPAWSFTIGTGAEAASILFAGGVDSQYSQLIHINKLTPQKNWYDAYLLNQSARLTRDALYELRFWAKIKFDPAKPKLSRNVLVYLVQSGGGTPAAISTYQAIDTNWKEYVIPFRCAGQGLQALYVGLGTDESSVLLDGFIIRSKSETGLIAGETIAASSIRRIRQDEALAVAPMRARDQVQFYDSLETAYFTNMERYLKQDLGFKGVVNYTQTNYASVLADTKVATSGDVAIHSTSGDYVSARPGLPYSDSLWMVRNTSMLRDRGAYVLGISSANSRKNKAFIISQSIATANQYATENPLYLTTYGSLQDWDGIFLGTYASDRAQLFSDSIPRASHYTIASQHALMSLVPASSRVFRDALISRAADSVNITHRSTEPWLYPSWRAYRGPFGVEGNLDFNIATQMKVRQDFNNPTQKVAAEYPYLPDTSRKFSLTEEIIWDQTNGILKVNSPNVYVYGGRNTDVEAYPAFTFQREDASNDFTALYLLPLDSLPVVDSRRMLLNIATRSQNTGMGWRDSLGFSNAWGTAPTIMSAVKMQLAFKSDEDSIDIYPLTPTGEREGTVIGTTLASDWSRTTIDQQLTPTTWFEVVRRAPTENSSVSNGSQIAGLGMRIEQNPVVGDQVKLIVTSETQAECSIVVRDLLGRIVMSLEDVTLASGSNRFSFECGELATGTYIVQLRSSGEVLTDKLSVAR